MLWSVSISAANHVPRLTSRPVSLGHIRAPLLPVLFPIAVLLETLLLLGLDLGVVDKDHCVYVQGPKGPWSRSAEQVGTGGVRA